MKVLNNKTRRTYYTPEKLDAARNNIKSYKWAMSINEMAKSEADKYLGLKYDFIWNLVTPQSLPRSYAVNQPLGCANCGKQIDKFGNYPYLADPTNDPWKLECPNCHMKFPTNDFKAYYESGRDKQGIFNPKLADRRFLVNKLSPLKDSSWGVDDGYGYVDKNGNKYTFIAYYNHWSLWYKGIINKMLNSLRDAYIYTGDIRYARPGIILLDRIADVYPNMDISQYKSSYGFLNSDGGVNMGKVVGCIWETNLAKDLLKAYDAFFPATNDGEVINFLSNISKKYRMLLSKDTEVEIRKNIEDGILRLIYPAVKRAQIRGNNGMHQSTLALAAIVIDTMPETKEWLDFVFQSGYESPTQITGGNILATLVNDIDRDGHGGEASPQYNKLWLSEYIELANILNGYNLYTSVNLYKNVKFKKMFSAMYPLMLTDIYSALIGDSGSTGSPCNYLDKLHCTMAFEHFGDPILAQIIYFLNNNTADGIHGDIFSPTPEKVASDIKAVIANYGILKLNGTNLTGYGFAALRDGRARINFELISINTQSPEPLVSAPDTQRDLWMYYGRNQNHGHRDTLNIGMNAFKLDLMPELGYPEYADQSPHRVEWVSNTISHNTVVVDNSKQLGQIVSKPKHFSDTEMVKLIDVEAPDVYRQTKLYRRTIAMIRVDDENSYGVDFFRVKGGTDHHFSFHGAEGGVTTEGLKLIPQVNISGQSVGSYAGPNVKFGKRPASDIITGFGYSGSGFHWLNNVERDNSPSEIFSVDWQIKDTWNVYGNGFGAATDAHLRLTMLGKMNEVALADGIPPRNKPKNPKNLKYVIAHRHGQNLDSLFTSIIEPYKTERYVDSISFAILRVKGQLLNDNVAKAIKVSLKNGRIDYIISSLDPNLTYTVDNKFEFRGFFGVYSEKDGKQVYSYINDGLLISDHIVNNEAKLSCTIDNFTKEMSIKNEIMVKFNSFNIKLSDLIGNYIYINNDGIRNATYLIKGVKKKAGNFFTLDIGDITPIRSWADANNFTKGYIYDISVGAKCSIPLVKIRINK